MSEVTVGHGGCGSGVPRLGDPLLDEYLGFVAARARHNTVLAQAFDLKVFFSVVAKDVREVTTADVLAFVEAQRSPRFGPNVVRLMRWRGGFGRVDDQAPAGVAVGAVRIPDGPRTGEGQSGSAWVGHEAARGSWGSLDQGASPAAPGVEPAGRERVDFGPAH